MKKLWKDWTDFHGGFYGNISFVSSWNLRPSTQTFPAASRCRLEVGTGDTDLEFYRDIVQC